MIYSTLHRYFGANNFSLIPNDVLAYLLNYYLIKNNHPVYYRFIPAERFYLVMVGEIRRVLIEKGEVLLPKIEEILEHLDQGAGETHPFYELCSYFFCHYQYAYNLNDFPFIAAAARKQVARMRFQNTSFLIQTIKNHPKLNDSRQILSVKSAFASMEYTTAEVDRLIEVEFIKCKFDKDSIVKACHLMMSLPVLSSAQTIIIIDRLMSHVKHDPNYFDITCTTISSLTVPAERLQLVLDYLTNVAINGNVGVRTLACSVLSNQDLSLYSDTRLVTKIHGRMKGGMGVSEAEYALMTNSSIPTHLLADVYQYNLKFLSGNFHSRQALLSTIIYQASHSLTVFIIIVDAMLEALKAEVSFNPIKNLYLAYGIDRLSVPDKLQAYFYEFIILKYIATKSNHEKVLLMFVLLKLTNKNSPHHELAYELFFDATSEIQGVLVADVFTILNLFEISNIKKERLICKMVDCYNKSDNDLVKNQLGDLFSGALSVPVTSQDLLFPIFYQLLKKTEIHSFYAIIRLLYRFELSQPNNDKLVRFYLKKINDGLSGVVSWIVDAACGALIYANITTTLHKAVLECMKKLVLIWRNRTDGNNYAVMTILLNKLQLPSFEFEPIITDLFTLLNSQSLNLNEPVLIFLIKHSDHPDQQAKLISHIIPYLSVYRSLSDDFYKLFAMLPVTKEDLLKIYQTIIKDVTTQLTKKTLALIKFFLHQFTPEQKSNLFDCNLKYFKAKKVASYRDRMQVFVLLNLSANQYFILIRELIIARGQLSGGDAADFDNIILRLSEQMPENVIPAITVFLHYFVEKSESPERAFYIDLYQQFSNSTLSFNAASNALDVMPSEIYNHIKHYYYAP